MIKSDFFYRLVEPVEKPLNIFFRYFLLVTVKKQENVDDKFMLMADKKNKQQNRYYKVSMCRGML